MLAYIKRHWRGEEELAHSYWINGVALGIPFSLASGWLEALYPPEMEFAPYLSLVFIYYLLFFFWVIWFTVGVWRSASGHVRSSGRKLWARFAQVIAALNLLTMPLVMFGGGVVIWNLGQAALGWDNLTPATLRLDKDNVLLLEGHIVFDTPAAFHELLDGNQRVRKMQLESLGGYVEPSRLMVEMIKARGLETYTSGQCLSACTYLFVSGSIRLLAPDGVLGFHQAGTGGLPDSLISRLDPGLDKFFLDQRVPQSFLDKVNKIPSTGMWKPTLQELVEANIVTHIYDQKRGATYMAGDYCSVFDCTALPAGAGGGGAGAGAGTGGRD